MHLIFPALAKTQGTLIIAGFVIVFTALAGMASVAYMDVVIGMLISVIASSRCPFCSDTLADGRDCITRCPLRTSPPSANGDWHRGSAGAIAKRR